MGNKYQLSGVNFIQMAGDILLLNLGIILAFLIRFNGQVPMINFEAYLKVLPFFSLFALFLFNFFGLYHTENKQWSEVSASLIVSIILQTLITIVMVYMFGKYIFPRTVFLIMPVFQLMLLGLWRWFMLNWERKNTIPKQIIIIAPYEEAVGLVKKAENGRDIILGLIVQDKIQANIQKFNILGTYESLNEILQNTNFNTIILSGNVPEKYKREVLQKCLKYNWEVLLVPGLYEILLSQNQIDQVDDTLVFKVGPTANLGREQIKRIVDFMIASIGILVSLPIMGLVALAIWLDSGRPILFCQERVSKRGKRFMLYKFRTMVNDAEKKTGPILAAKKDPRITRVGGFLRATRLDELPQLFNILKGEMSVVGPRPERPFFVEQFEKEIPEYSYRHLVNPGLTGLAQVAGKYSTTVEDKIKYDLLYLKGSSLLFDLQIMLQTVKVLFMKDKAS